MHAQFPPVLFLSIFGSLVVSNAFKIPLGHYPHDKVLLQQRAASASLPLAWQGASSLLVKGHTGVSAMQLTPVGNNHVLIIDKAENNPMKIGSEPAWMSYMSTSTYKTQAIATTTNSFCGAGSWLSNGTLVSIGGNPRVGYGDADGLQAIRMFNDCGEENCKSYENPKRIRMASKRWYPATTRLQDGSIFIAGGMTDTGFNNKPEWDNPTIEYYPHKGIHDSKGLPIYSKFLANAKNTNLFPVTWLLPDGNLFIAANKHAMIYNWQKNVETPLPDTPNGVIINYPWTAASALLPLRPSNKYTPEVWFCGGSRPNQDPNADPSNLSSTDPTSKQCIRMVLNAADIKKGWRKEVMPVPRIMSVGVLTPTGDIVITGGASSGVAGFDDVPDSIGSSNADNPALTPVLYQTDAPQGSRFSSNFPTSQIPRMYHSSAVFLPDGRIMLAGSNPNNDVTTRHYQTEYRSEFLSPPYMFKTRPSFTEMPDKIGYAKKFTLRTKNIISKDKVQVVIMDLGFNTHGVTYNQRLVELVCVLGKGGQLTVAGPPTTGVYPPGPAFLFVLSNGVPSAGQKIVIGNERAPPEDMKATANVLSHTIAV